MTLSAWASLVDEFRALGGTAENIEMRNGPRGRGLFAIDPSKPVRLHVPPNLLVPIEDVELRNGQLMVKAATTLGSRERSLFEHYQRELAWNAGVFDELWRVQQQWSQLPSQIQDTLREVGWLADAPNRFREPSEALCVQQYLNTRAISYLGNDVLMPLVELLNHSDAVPGFDPSNGISVSGVFEQEVLVNYGCDDCWGRALSHGFCDPTGYALSLAFSYQCADGEITIHHDFHRQQLVNGFRLPLVGVENGSVEFSFLILGHLRYPRLPRALFQHVTKNMPISAPDELFDILQHYNRLQFLKVLRVTENPSTPLVALLRNAAYQQLEALSNYWGTASLAAEVPPSGTQGSTLGADPLRPVSAGLPSSVSLTGGRV